MHVSQRFYLHLFQLSLLARACSNVLSNQSLSQAPIVSETAGVAVAPQRSDAGAPRSNWTKQNETLLICTTVGYSQVGSDQHRNKLSHLNKYVVFWCTDICKGHRTPPRQEGDGLLWRMTRQGVLGSKTSVYRSFRSVQKCLCLSNVATLIQRFVRTLLSSQRSPRPVFLMQHIPEI